MKKLLYYCTMYIQYVTGIKIVDFSIPCTVQPCVLDATVSRKRAYSCSGLGEGAQKSGKVFHAFTAVVENEANYK